MESVSPPHLSIRTKYEPLQLHRTRAISPKTQISGKIKANSTSFMLDFLSWKIKKKEQGHYSSPSPSAASDHNSGKSGLHLSKSNYCEIEYNWVDCLVQALHKSARSFSTAIQSLESARSGPELAKAWIGVDVNAWHKQIAYRAAVYALLKAATEPGFLLSDEHHRFSVVQEIFSPKIDLLGEFIERKLNMKDSTLVKWFKLVKLPLLASSFIPMFKKRWPLQCARSGFAVIILAISCCVAVEKLGIFTISMQDIVGKLIDLSDSLVAIDELHQFASMVGLEQKLLAHFGPKVLTYQSSQEVQFWIGLVQEKLSIAFHRESVIMGLQAFHHGKVHEKDLATLGLFAFLGRSTRLFLSRIGIKDLDEQFKDFLGYLECGILFVFPEFSSLSLYQHFMEVVTEEIGWLDFYAAFPCTSNQERRRSKQHIIHAEKEIFLSTVFNVCSEVFSGFSQFSSSTQQPLDAKLVSFLVHSQNLLAICLEDYWAAYCRSSELLRITERGLPKPIAPLGSKCTRSSVTLDKLQKRAAYIIGTRGNPEYIDQSGSQLSKYPGAYDMDEMSLLNQGSDAEQKAKHESLLNKSSNMLMSASSDIRMGTQLLFIDISVALVLLLKQIQRRKLTARERKKLKRTLVDFISVIPVAILMLLPVSAVGHAAILATIKKYIPCLIPSPYSSERLDLVKQLNRTKKMEPQSWSNAEDVSSTAY